MSLQSATEFAQSLPTNPAVMAEIRQAASAGTLDEAVASIATIGKREGYDFSPAEAAELRGAGLKALGDSELDAVAGGGGTDPNTIAITYVAGQVAGQFIPVGGGIIGAGVGAGVGAAIGGASASGSLAAGAVGAATSMNNTKSDVQQFFSGW